MEFESDSNVSIKYFQLSQEEIDSFEKILAQEKVEKSEFWYRKYEDDARRNWDIFYKENENKFFQDRHYLHKELPEISNMESLLEVGCGVGNTLFPIKEQFPAMKCFGIDFSKRAIDIIKSSQKELIVDVVDVVKENIPSEWGNFSLITLIFVLSAISPENHLQVIQKLKQRLQKGGIFYFRDYAIYDLAQIRFASKGGSKLKPNFYVRGDGTRSYFFSKQEIQNLFESCGFCTLDLEYHCRIIENRKDGLEMKRVWLQGKFTL